MTTRPRRVEGEETALPVDEADGLGNRLEDRVRVEAGGRLGDLSEIRVAPGGSAVSAHREGV